MMHLVIHGLIPLELSSRRTFTDDVVLMLARPAVMYRLSDEGETIRETIVSYATTHCPPTRRRGRVWRNSMCDDYNSKGNRREGTVGRNDYCDQLQ